MTYYFEWNESKATANLTKHGVSFAEAKSVFADPLARIHDDEEHSTDERREIVIGHSDAHRLLVVFFTQRKWTLRIFSAREATITERWDYEENSQP